MPNWKWSVRNARGDARVRSVMDERDALQGFWDQILHLRDEVQTSATDHTCVDPQGAPDGPWQQCGWCVSDRLTDLLLTHDIRRPHWVVKS